MSQPCRSSALRRSALWIAVAATAVAAGRAQTPQNDPQALFRAGTELVRSDLVVFDRDGRFVDDLGRDDFELLIDGKPHPIAFFERVEAGTANERRQLAAARGASPVEALSDVDSGRTVLFFVDDYHLSNAGVEQARQVIGGFLDREMGPQDRTAIATASSQLGFLEQASRYRPMLRAAVARLAARPKEVSDLDIPRMTPHQAQIIERNGDRELFEFYVRETLKQTPIMRREAAEALVTGRARHMVAQSSAIARQMLIALERFLRLHADVPGRKLVFFISDGFATHPADNDVNVRFQQIADTAARSGSAIYTIDARGLATQPSYDASQKAVIDDTRSVDRANADELFVSQEPMYRLAAETGGRALLNSNALATFVPRVLDETSRYYLIAWTPPESQQTRRFRRIEINVRGRSNLTVRVPRGFYEAAPAAADRTTPAPRGRRQAPPPPETKESPMEAALLAALRSPHPVTTLPTSTALTFMDLPDSGSVISVAADLRSALQGSGATDTLEPAVVDLVFAVFDDKGQGVTSVKEQVTVTPERSIYMHRFKVKPGLYQVRMAARDSRSERVGSAMEWIEIPAAGSGAFSLSGLIIEQGSDAQSGRQLRFFTYIYSASRSADRLPDVTIRTEVFRGDKRVIATPPAALKTIDTREPARIPYLAMLNLEGLPPGSYVLQVTAIDRAGVGTATQRAEFVIE